jgi:hypothetical protein
MGLVRSQCRFWTRHVLGRPLSVGRRPVVFLVPDIAYPLINAAAILGSTIWIAVAGISRANRPLKQRRESGVAEQLETNIPTAH